MVNVELTNNKGYSWTHYNNIHCKGYAFIDDELYENISLAKQFDGLSREEAIGLSKKLNGFFSVVVEYDEGVLALVDHVRSFPLFYYKSEDNLIVRDELTEETIKTFSINSSAQKQLQGSVYLLWDQTIFEGVFGIEAGAFLWAEHGGEITYKFYYEFKYAGEQISDLDIALARMNVEYEKTFKRLIKFLNGRTAVIPLSGGHDSRLVAYYLVKLGYKNIIAFSYGDPEISDSKISKQAAEALGLKYYYIPYERTDLRKAFKKHYKDYMMYATNGVSLPGLQTWYAVHWLHENKIIDENSVFCPGYGGVLPGHYVHSSYMEQEFIKKETLIKQFETEYFASLSRLEPDYYTEFMKKFNAVSDIADLPGDVPSRRAAEIFEQWIYREDQTKGIQNAVRMYEFYGAKWATPFFEKQQFELWSHIDNSLRYKNKAFKEMEKTLFEGPISEVPFTGSKEVEIVTKNRNVIEKCLHMLDVCLHPRKNHYMNVIVPIGTHIYNTVFKRISNPFYYIKTEYLKKINRISK